MPAKKRKLKSKKKVKRAKPKRKVKAKRSKPKRKAKKPVRRKSAPLKRKINLALTRFIFFAILFVLCLVLYSVSSGALWVNIFGTLAIIFGFVSIALLITLLILLFMKK